MRHLRHIGLAALAVGLGLAVTLFAAPVASGHPAKQSGGRIIAPTGTWDGRTAGELLGDVWYRLYSLPAPDNPVFGNGDACFRLGRTGGVVYLTNSFPPDHLCNVKQGTPVYINGLFTAWSSAEDPYPRDEATQRALALASDETAATALISVDGGRPVDARDRRFSVFSPQRTVQLPRENILEIPPPPRPITLTAHGWMAMIVDLPPGLHAILLETTWVDGSEPYIRTRYVNVVRR
jgi:hypothetical protein